VWGGWWKWASFVGPEDYRSARIIANGKSRLSRLSIRASHSQQMPRTRFDAVPSVSCYGPYVRFAIALAVGIDAWQTKCPSLWGKSPFREANRRSSTKILGIVWNLQLLLVTAPTPNPDVYSPHLISILILSSHLLLVFQLISFLHAFTSNFFSYAENNNFLVHERDLIKFSICSPIWSLELTWFVSICSCLATRI